MKVDKTPNAINPTRIGKLDLHKIFHSKPLGTHYTIIPLKKRLFKSVISNSINYKKKVVYNSVNLPLHILKLRFFNL